MAINKATLAKEIDGKIEYIYPKTTSDMVEYTPSQTVKEKLDNLTLEDTRINERIDNIVVSGGDSSLEVVDARIAKSDGVAKTSLRSRIDTDYNYLTNSIENTSNKLDLKSEKYNIVQSVYNAFRGNFNSSTKTVSGSAPKLYSSLNIEEGTIICVSGYSKIADNIPLYAILDSSNNILDQFPSSGTETWSHEGKVIVAPAGASIIYVNGVDDYPCIIEVLEEKPSVDKLREELDALKEGNIYEEFLDDTFDTITDSDGDPIMLNVMFGQKLTPFFDAIEEGLRTEYKDADNSILSYVFDNLLSIDNRLNELEYQPIEIIGFSAEPLIGEIGSTIESLTFSYRFNKKGSLVETADINGMDVNPAEPTTLEVNISSETTFTLTATDLKGAQDTATLTIYFYNNLYYGASSIPAEYDDTFLLGLSNELTDDKANTVSVMANAGEYVYYCIPSRLGTPTFNKEFTLVDTISHTNASGYTEAYDIYKSDSAGLSEVTIIAT